MWVGGRRELMDAVGFEGIRTYSWVFVAHECVGGFMQMGRRCMSALLLVFFAREDEGEGEGGRVEA
jgi:hypothetical protein